MNPGVSGAAPAAVAHQLEGRDELNLDPHRLDRFLRFRGGARREKPRTVTSRPGGSASCPVQYSRDRSPRCSTARATGAARREPAEVCTAAGTASMFPSILARCLRGMGGALAITRSPVRTKAESSRCVHGRQFRLPTGVDEFAVADLDVAAATRELRWRCVVHGDFEAASRMCSTQPWRPPGLLVSQELSASCPHCRGESNDAAFRCARFFSTRWPPSGRFLNHENPLARPQLWLEPVGRSSE